MKRSLTYLLSAALLLALSACTKERLPERAASVPDGAMVDMKFSLVLPSGNEHPATRALNEFQEQELQRLDLLAFRIDGGQEKFAYHTSLAGFRSYQENVSLSIKVFKGGNTHYRFVLLFNLSAEQGDALNDLAAGTPIDGALRGIQIRQADKWPSDGSRLIPMWGQSESVVVDDARIASGIGGIKLVRMMARIDVAVATPDAKDDFKLQSVHLYNTNHRGTVAPFAQNWNPAGNAVTAPSVPVDPETEPDPLVYTTASSTNEEFKRIIYTFESAARQGDPLHTPCIVVGGFYGSDTQLSYYRLDFLGADKKTYLDLLRNHCYAANITKVLARGYDTPDDAFRGTIRMTADIIPWNEAPQTTVFDRQYKLSLSRDVIGAGKEAFSTSMTLTTDYAGTDTGFPAGVFVGPVVYTTGASGWLKIADNAGADGSMTRNIQITGTENTSGIDRTARFTVTAGNLQYVVKVSQSKNPWLIYGWASIYIMDGNTKFVEASSNFDWTVEVKEGTNLQGGLAALLSTSGGHAQNEQVYFTTFDDWASMLAGSPTKTADTAVLTFKDAAGVCPDMDVKIWLASGVIQEFTSNCYMLPANSAPILIPVSRANEPSVTGTTTLGRQIVFNDALGANFVWTDSPAGLSPQGAVRSVIPVGDGDTGYLLVRPGSSDGNAVVAVTTKGIIRWSWHIWVTDYRPTGNWLDRNLGALSNVPGNPGTSGLLYQWGRKDPFPGKNNVWYDQNKTSNQPAIVSIDGLYYDPIQEITNSVRNPMAFFKAGYNARGNSWGGSVTPAVKEIYDPCPAGYKVPVYTTWSSFNTGSFLWNGSNGRTSASAGGFYPVTGARNNGGALVQTGNGYYWSATSDASDASPRLSFTSSAVGYNAASFTSHADAYAIRCVAENPQ